MIKIVLNRIQFKLFVMLLCHNEILLQNLASIVSSIAYWEFSHFHLYYFYSSSTVLTCMQRPLDGILMEGAHSTCREVCSCVESLHVYMCAANHFWHRSMDIIACLVPCTLRGDPGSAPAAIS